MSPTPLLRIPVAVLVNRVKATSPWIEHVWSLAAVLPGEPEASPWTLIAEEAGRATFLAGTAAVELFRSDTGNYRDNLTRAEPLLWVVLRPTGAEPPYQLLAVTADPSEGEAFTEPGTDLVETAPMPAEVRDRIEEFVLTHHVEREFFKRRRTRADPEALARRPRTDRGGGE